MAKQVITMRVLCIDVPTSAAGFEDIQFGLQDKDKRLLYGSTNTNDQRQYDFTLSVQQHSDETPNFTGAYAHGDRTNRFLYLTLMGQRDDDWKIIKRIKIQLRSITWDQVQAVLDDASRLLEVTVSGKGTATVPLLGDGWVAKRRDV